MHHKVRTRAAGISISRERSHRFGLAGSCPTDSSGPSSMSSIDDPSRKWSAPGTTCPGAVPSWDRPPPNPALGRAAPAYGFDLRFRAARLGLPSRERTCKGRAALAHWDASRRIPWLTSPRQRSRSSSSSCVRMPIPVSDGAPRACWCWASRPACGRVPAWQGSTHRRCVVGGSDSSLVGVPGWRTDHASSDGFLRFVQTLAHRWPAEHVVVVLDNAS